ncbi:MAG: hypothetical protein V4702_04665 [Patescibacteria group bacterium]
MDNTYWHKQTEEKPLFPDLLWSRPETKSKAGKLLIVGGNQHGFAAPAEAYNESLKAGAGVANVVLPSAIQKVVGGFFENAFFAPSTPSGSFSTSALSELLHHSSWADGVLLAGNFGRNSETAILLEKFLEDFDGLLVITQDALDYFLMNPKHVLERPNTSLVASMEQLQKLTTNVHFTTAITLGMDFIKLVETLHELSLKFPANFVVKQHQQILVAFKGQVSTTTLQDDMEIWRVRIAAHAAVWWLQNPAKTFEALTTSVVATDDQAHPQ